jgi:hypothetical protein
MRLNKWRAILKRLMNMDKNTYSYEVAYGKATDNSGRWPTCAVGEHRGLGPNTHRVPDWKLTSREDHLGLNFDLQVRDQHYGMAMRTLKAIERLPKVNINE